MNSTRQKKLCNKRSAMMHTNIESRRVHVVILWPGVHVSHAAPVSTSLHTRQCDLDKQQMSTAG